MIYVLDRSGVLRYLLFSVVDVEGEKKDEIISREVSSIFPSTSTPLRSSPSLPPQMDSEVVISALAQLLDLSPGLDGRAGKLLPFEELGEVALMIVCPTPPSLLPFSTRRSPHSHPSFHIVSLVSVQEADAGAPKRIWVSWFALVGGEGLLKRRELTRTTTSSLPVPLRGSLLPLPPQHHAFGYCRLQLQRGGLPYLAVRSLGELWDPDVLRRALRSSTRRQSRRFPQFPPRGRLQTPFGYR